MIGRGAQVGGDEVVGVATELVMSQPDDEALNRARREEQQERSADQLEEAGQPLEDDTDFEGDVELGALAHPVSRHHRAKPSTAASSPGLPTICSPSGIPFGS